MNPTVHNTLTKEYAATRNACKLCSPLGASIAFKGIKGCVPLIYGSQGCATYVRRYTISHFREPVDIASSNFNEEATIFGGNKHFIQSINNIISQYAPQVIGIASTCLSETIGEDVLKLIKEYQDTHLKDTMPDFVFASTPSYQGTHMDGFHTAVASTIRMLAKAGRPLEHINIFPGFISPADIRCIKNILSDMEIDFILSPDYSSTLDNPNWKEYHRIPPGGTDVQSIQDTANAKGSIEFGYAFHKTIKRQSSIATAGEILESTFSVPKIQQKLPIGIRLTDLLFDNLKKLTGKDIPNRYKDERGRLVDAYVDAHKTLFGVKAVVYGEEDFVISMVSFLEEIGVHTVLATSGGNSGLLKQGVEEVVCNKHHQITVKHDCDFEQVNELVDELKPDMLIGNSKGYYISRRLNIPLIRVGFPIHDRVGAQRVQHLAYSGTQQLLDRITNAIIAHKQDASPIGYKYM